MAIDCGIKCVDSLDGKFGYTYFHESLGHRSWIDHVFISSSAANTLQDYMTLDLGCNNSDHHPIIWSLKCSYPISGVNDGNHAAPINKRSYKSAGIKQT